MFNKKVVSFSLLMLSLSLQSQSSYAELKCFTNIRTKAMVCALAIASTYLECVAGNGCLTYSFYDCSPTQSGFVNLTTGVSSGTLNFNDCKLKCHDYSQCFSGDDTVEILLDGEGDQTKRIPMAELKVGQKVVIGKDHDGNLRAEKVVDFFHREPNTKAVFLSIYFEGSKEPLFITSKHLINRAEVQGQSYDPESNNSWVFADQLREGDWIFFKGASTQINKIETGIERTGLYAPLTEKSCTIQVNGVGASCFSEITSQRFGKMYTKIRRYFVNPLEKENCNRTHIHPVGRFDSACHWFAKKFSLTQSASDKDISTEQPFRAEDTSQCED